MDNKIESLINLYESAKNQSNHEGDLIWQKFSAFIVAHAIFLALIGQIITSKRLDNPNIYIRFLSGTGLFLSFLWLISTVRGYETLEYWKSSAIEIAGKIFVLLNKDKVKLINYYERGYKYFMGYEKVTFKYEYKVKEKEDVNLRRSDFSYFFRFINTRRTAYLSISVIIVLYSLVLISSFRGSFDSKYSGNTNISHPIKIYHDGTFNKYWK